MRNLSEEFINGLQRRLEALEDVMCGISDDLFAAGWLDGLEYNLWAIVVGDPLPEAHHPGYERLTEQQFKALRDAFVSAGHWLHYTSTGVQPVETVEWYRLYKAWRASHV